MKIVSVRIRRQLTVHELEVLALAAHGLESAEIGWVLGRSRKTVEAHLAGVFKKLAVRNRVEAFAAMGWLRPPEIT